MGAALSTFEAQDQVAATLLSASLTATCIARAQPRQNSHTKYPFVIAPMAFWITPLDFY